MGFAKLFLKVLFIYKSPSATAVTDGGSQDPVRNPTGTYIPELLFVDVLETGDLKTFFQVGLPDRISQLFP